MEIFRLPELVGRPFDTTLTLTVLFDSQEARDATLKSGMEKGVAVSYDRLADLLAEARVGNG